MLYFCAFLIPVEYFVVTGNNGAVKKGMPIRLAIHVFWCLAVYGFVYYSWHADYSEYYWGWALMIPVKLISAVYCLGFLLWKRRRGAKSPEPTSGLAPGRGSS